MRFETTIVAVAACIALMSCADTATKPSKPQMGPREFERLLVTLAHGWNSNDPELAISVFAKDAIYAEPPNKQLYAGRDAIFEFFGGPNGRSTWMKMVWHYMSFNEEQQVGAGEFTFSWEGGQVHGVVSIKLKDGLIYRWREYFYESDLDWDEFQMPSRF